VIIGRRRSIHLPEPAAREDNEQQREQAEAERQPASTPELVISAAPGR
jgi:hypothetical protein